MKRHKLLINGREVTEEEFFRDAPREDSGASVPAIGAYSEATPLESVGCACHPSQVEEFNEHAHKAGLTGVHHRPDGVVEFTSQGQRAKWLKYRGFHDEDGGFCDG
jgi:hypothetical protein